MRASCHFNPSSFMRRLQRGVKHGLAAYAISERRLARLSPLHAFDKLKRLVVAIAPATVVRHHVARRAGDFQPLVWNIVMSQQPGWVERIFTECDHQPPGVL